MEVRYARSHLYIQAGSGPQDNHQLFFARAPVVTTEDELKQLFSEFGEVESINLFHERRTHASKGCGFVTMATREQAVAAMNALDEKQLLEGSVTQLAVKWADPELQIKKKRAVEDSNAENRMLFFAKVLRSANEDEVKQLFTHLGRVVEVNLFRAFQVCGVVICELTKHLGTPAQQATCNLAMSVASTGLANKVLGAVACQSQHWYQC
eukprot:GHUV01034836.1.p1 GENE.GHUV01034836.1~~GHUV01034836.1.p1  ORF type:complete len:209 (+),score=50.80 GHUV01034836.1:1094-1720(+)